MPTMRQVAEKAAVSLTTVSHVINNTRFVSTETRRRVENAMLELGYQPNALARSLRRGETHTLGLILPDSANPFFAEIGRAIEEAAFQQGYNVILCNTEGNLHKEHIYVDVLSKKQVDGIIFVASGGQSDSLRPLLRQGLPLVLVDRELPDLQVDSVLSDNRQAGYAATRHLIELGHRRIGCISGPSDLTPSAQRITGYRQALEEAGLPYDERLVARGDFHPQSGYRGAKELLALPEPPTAIFALNDLMALGALNAIAECGLQAGRPAVVGFDDIELASYTVPPLTTLAQPKTAMGQTAIELLIQRIADKKRPNQRIQLASRLVVRASSGANL